MNKPEHINRMNTINKLKPGEPITMICPPNIKVMITGANHCDKGVEYTTLHYVDGTLECVKTDEIKNCDWDNWFSIVGSIQELRKKP